MWLVWLTIVANSAKFSWAGTWMGSWFTTLVAVCLMSSWETTYMKEEQCDCVSQGAPGPFKKKEGVV